MRWENRLKVLENRALGRVCAVFWWRNVRKMSLAGLL
jgi:hypothetical protein